LLNIVITKKNPKEIRNNTLKQVKLICQERTGHMVYGVLGYYIYWLIVFSHNANVFTFVALYAFSVSTPRAMSLWVLGHTMNQLNVISN